MLMPSFRNIISIQSISSAFLILFAVSRPMLMSAACGKFYKSSLVICGPSGVGKGTLISALMATQQNKFMFSVSHTTRSPRPGEKDGVEYYFIDRPDMETRISAGRFLEYAQVHTNLYGTSLEAVESVHSKGKVCILDVDVQGVKQIKSSRLSCKYVFIAPPSLATLETRLRHRNTETDIQINTRIENAKKELEYGTYENFDAIIINDNLEKSCIELNVLASKWFPSIKEIISV